jgi:hypothetical protein
MMILLKKQGMARDEATGWGDKIVDGPSNSALT